MTKGRDRRAFLQLAAGAALGSAALPPGVAEALALPANRVTGTIKDVEQVLHPSRFLRVHRSTIVNIDAVAEFIRGRYGDLVAVLKSGKRLAVGRRYRRLLVAALQAIAGVLA